jgi:hypothetical protein
MCLLTVKSPSKKEERQKKTERSCHVSPDCQVTFEEKRETKKVIRSQDHVENLQHLFPPHDNPIQMGEDLFDHWLSEIEISEMWNTQEVFERKLKFHSIPTVTTYDIPFEKF